MAWLVVFVCLFVWILQMRFPLISIFNIFCILEKKNASLFIQNNSKHYKGILHSKKSRPFSHPLLPVLLASLVLLDSLPVPGRYCVLSSPDVDFLCLESPPRHQNPSGLSTSLTHPGKSFLTYSGWFPSFCMFPHFPETFPHCTYQSDCCVHCFHVFLR